MEALLRRPLEASLTAGWSPGSAEIESGDPSGTAAGTPSSWRLQAGQTQSLTVADHSPPPRLEGEVLVSWWLGWEGCEGGNESASGAGASHLLQMPLVGDGQMGRESSSARTVCRVARTPQVLCLGVLESPGSTHHGGGVWGFPRVKCR